MGAFVAKEFLALVTPRHESRCWTAGETGGTLLTDVLLTACAAGNGTTVAAAVLFALGTGTQLAVGDAFGAESCSAFGTRYHWAAGEAESFITAGTWSQGAVGCATFFTEGHFAFGAVAHGAFFAEVLFAARTPIHVVSALITSKLATLWRGTLGSFDVAVEAVWYATKGANLPRRKRHALGVFNQWSNHVQLAHPLLAKLALFTFVSWTLTHSHDEWLEKCFS